MKDFIKRYNILIQLVVLVVTLSSLSFYNYVSQKNLFIQQLEDHTIDLMQSLRSSILKFRSVEQTLSTQKLVQRISLNLDIFEFRYLNKDGIVISSMFQDEVGEPYHRPGIEKAITDVTFLGEFYLEERDMTQVLAVSYPVYHNKILVGIIDLAVDAPELNSQESSSRKITRRRMELDITNMLNAIAGSISNSMEVYDTVNMTEFLQHLVNNSEGVVELTIMTRNGRVASSSQKFTSNSSVQLPARGAALIKRDGSSLYRLLSPLEDNVVDDDSLLLYIDASDYAANERKLLLTALATSFLAIFFSSAVVYAIYRINLNRARKENIRLEGMVKQRTAEIEKMSKTDKLTGLANRMHLDDQLEIEFKRATRHKHNLVMLVVDLDH
ncbi:MAG: diguanylate cyclase, partial [Gammaproteobacteria bacterium]|nr:diguanylate cyclase [Gammaproteobacteria bacterium]